MKILIIDRDKLSSQMIRAKLEPEGYEIVEEAMKNDAIERLKTEAFDAVFVDPAPLPQAHPVVLEVRRNAKTYPYVLLMSQTTAREDAFRIGCNDILQKPTSTADIREKADNARRMTTLVNWLGDEKEDFPSAGGVISKSAFNQLFRSAMDRAGRYGELSYVVVITLENYDDIKLDFGAYASDYAVSKMAYHLALMRRQSDIIGQTGKNQYALLLQRPLSETEPVEAAARFAAGLGELDDIAPPKCDAVNISVQLIHLPTGVLKAEHHLTKKDQLTSNG